VTRRILALATLVTAIAAVMPACGKKRVGAADELRSILARTEAISRQFRYREDGPDGQIVVSGAVADDFRYKALVQVDGRNVLTEVVRDDALADRVLDQSAVALFDRARRSTGATTAPGAGATEAVAPPDPQVLQAIESGAWVLDDAGAPNLSVPVGDRTHRVGQDPIFDALTIFGYVRQAVGASPFVNQFDPDSLEYKPKEDPFPKPAKGSGVIRYDFARASIPKPGGSSNANQPVPDAFHFRKMAVYVKAGVVIQVREVIDVASRLRDISRNYDIRLSPDDSVDARVKTALDAINAVRVGQGNEPIRLRTMRLDLSDIGKPQSVELPTDAIAGSLLLFENRGAPPA
jgi:hypothetical protein